MDEKPKPEAGKPTDRRSKRKELYKPSLANDVRLVWKLMGHPDVPTRLKLLPIFGFVYFVWPWDVAIGPVDDAFVMWLCTSFFLENCPPHALQQIKEEIANPAIKIKHTRSYQPVDEGDIVDGEFVDLDQAKTQQGPETPPKKSAGGKRSRRTQPKDPNAL
jgi:uncharacterized membrane protein YkvA (DUF1232 family)